MLKFFQIIPCFERNEDSEQRTQAPDDKDSHQNNWFLSACFSHAKLYEPNIILLKSNF